MKKILASLLIVMLLAASLIGCSEGDVIAVSDNTEVTSTVTTSSETSTTSSQESSDVVVDESVTSIDSIEVEVSNTSDNSIDTTIELNGSNATVKGDGVVVKDSVIYIQAPGVYELSGSFEGQIQVETELEGTVQLLLNGVDLVNDESAAIYVVNADETIITLKENTENTIRDTSSYTEDDGTDQERINGAIYSKDDLILNGSGTLTIVAANKTGILGKDSLTVESGQYDIQAGVNGIKGKDLVYIFDGTFNISSGTDGIDSEIMVYIEGGDITIYSDQDGLKSDETIYVTGGTIEITAEDDGIHGDVLVQFDGGQVSVLDSYEGIEAKDIVINDGIISVNASDDGVNATDGSGEAFGHMEMGGSYDWGLHINGGQLTLNAYGDGLDSNGNVWMTGGIVVVSGPVDNGNGSLDYNGSFEMTGGYLVASGSSGMFQDQGSASSIYSIAVGFDSSLAAGTLVEIKDEAGNTLLSYTPAKEFTSLLFASPDLQMGSNFEVFLNGSTYATVTIADVVNTVGNISSGMMPGGRPSKGEGGFH